MKCDDNMFPNAKIIGHVSLFFPPFFWGNNVSCVFFLCSFFQFCITMLQIDLQIKQ